MPFKLNPITGNLDLVNAGTVTNAFTTITTPSGTSPVADSSTDTLTFAATGLSITGNSTTDTVTFALAMAAIGSTANANGATLSSGSLTLQPASASFGGVVTTGTQTFAGSKTFSSAPTLSSLTAMSVPFIGTGGLVSQSNSSLSWNDTLKGLSVNVGNPASTPPSAALHVLAGTAYTIGAASGATVTANIAAVMDAPSASEVGVNSVAVASGDVVVDSVNYINVGSGSFTEAGQTPSSASYGYKDISGTTWRTNLGSATNASTDDTGLVSYDVEVVVGTFPTGVDGVVVAMTINSTTYYNYTTTPGAMTFTTSSSTSDPSFGTLAFQSAGGSRNYRARAYGNPTVTTTVYYSAAYDYTLTEPTSGSYYIITHDTAAFPAGNGSTITNLVIYGANDGSVSFTNSFDSTVSSSITEGPNYWGSIFAGATTETPTQWGIVGSGQTVLFRIRGEQNIRGYSDLFSSSTVNTNNVTIPNTGLRYYLETSISSAPSYTAPSTAVNAWKYYFDKSTNNGSSFALYAIVNTSSGFGTGIVKYDDGSSSYTAGNYTASPTAFSPAASYIKGSTGTANPFSSTAGYELPAVYDSDGASRYSGFEIRNQGNRTLAAYGVGSTTFLGTAGTLNINAISTNQQYASFSQSQTQIGTSSFPQLFNIPSTVFTSGVLYVSGASSKVNIGTTTGSGTFNVAGNSSSSQILMSMQQGSGVTGDTLEMLNSSGAQGWGVDADFKQTARRGKATTGTYFYTSGGVTSQSVSSIGNTGTGEDTLKTYTCQANELGTNGDSLNFFAGGTFAAVDAAATKRLKVKFASTTIFDSGAVVVAVATTWSVRGFIIRTSSTAIRYSIYLMVGDMTLAFNYVSEGALTGLTLSNSNSLSFTGECSSATNNEVTQESLITEWFGAP